MQAGLKGGKPWYKGGSDGKMAVWYVDDNADKHHPGTQWVIGFARHVGKMYNVLLNRCHLQCGHSRRSAGGHVESHTAVATKQ